MLCSVISFMSIFKVFGLCWISNMTHLVILLVVLGLCIECLNSTFVNEMVSDLC